MFPSSNNFSFHQVYRVGNGYHKEKGKLITNNAATDYDLTQKSINPMGGFPHYGLVTNDFIMIKGGCVGSKNRLLVIRKVIYYVIHTHSIS